MLGMLAPSGLKMALLAALAVAIAGAYWHYTTVKGERDAALAQVGALQVAHETQKATIATLEGAVDQWKEQAEKFQATLDALADAQVEANSQARKLNDVLGKHDLERLSEAKPALIERRINSGTADVFRMFESATGGRNDNGD